MQTGAWILPDTRPLPADLVAFLGAGSPPVYVGFGSIAVPSAKEAGRVAIDAIHAQGRLGRHIAPGWLLDPNRACSTFMVECRGKEPKRCPRGSARQSR